MKDQEASERMESIARVERVESITDGIEADLKEAAHWFGGWDKLREVIARLEENENEAAAERYYSGGSDAWSGGFAENH